MPAIDKMALRLDIQQMTSPPCQLYLVTPPSLDPPRFADLLARALDAGSVACVQLRLKQVDDDTIRRAAEVLAPVAQSRDIAFILNDRPDLAAEMGCDGVHIGGEDTPYAQSRKTVGDGAIVGVTCHDSRHLAMIGAEQGADYVAFGAFFPTVTKVPKTKADTALVEWWSEMMEVPCVAIGGITPSNCRPLVEAGADFLAVVSAVWDDPDGPDAAVRQFRDVIG